MSRSYKKEPYYSCNAGSFKSWKQIVNSTYRSRCKQRIYNCKDWDELLLPIIDECGNFWNSPKDGSTRRHEKPALNQCELDLEERIKRVYRVYRWYGDEKPLEHLEKIIKEYKKDYIHGGDYCNCYSNKRNSWYWKMIRK